MLMAPYAFTYLLTEQPQKRQGIVRLKQKWKPTIEHY